MGVKVPMPNGLDCCDSVMESAVLARITPTAWSVGVIAFLTTATFPTTALVPSPVALIIRPLELFEAVAVPVADKTVAV
jgi:hypothetical protein